MEFVLGSLTGLLLAALVFSIVERLERKRDQNEVDDVNDTVRDILEAERQADAAKLDEYEQDVRRRAGLEDLDLNDPASIRDHIPSRTLTMATQPNVWSHLPEPLSLAPHEFQKWNNEQEKLKGVSKKIKATLLKRMSDEEFDKLLPLTPEAEKALEGRKDD